MKSYRIFAVILGLLLVVPTSGLAQQPTSRLSIGAGGGTIPDWLDLFSGALLSVGSLGNYRTETRSQPLAINVQYDHFLSDRLALLGAAGGQRISRNVFVSGEPRGTMSSTYAHLMGGAALHFRRGRTVGLYSNISGGIALNHDSSKLTDSPSDSESRVLPAFQVTALGLRVGEPFGAFLELGAGYRGMVVFGVSYGF